VNDPRSPLAQRVRRLLVREGRGAVALPHPPPHQRPIDSGMLFESQLARLSKTLRDLRAIDRQREAELRALRERVAIADAVAHAVFAERLAPALARIDGLVAEITVLLQPPPEPPASATLFERMRARRASTGVTQAERELLLGWAALLADLRLHLASMAED
jgi:hypothetical protein